MTGVLIGRHQDADTHRDDLAKMERQPSTSPEGGLRETARQHPGLRLLALDRRVRVPRALPLCSRGSPEQLRVIW